MRRGFWCGRFLRGSRRFRCTIRPSIASSKPIRIIPQTQLWINKNLMSCLYRLKLCVKFGFPSRISVGMVLQSKLPELLLDFIRIGARGQTQVRIVIPAYVRFHHLASAVGTLCVCSSTRGRLTKQYLSHALPVLYSGIGVQQGPSIYRIDRRARGNSNHVAFQPTSSFPRTNYPQGAIYRSGQKR